MTEEKKSTRGSVREGMRQGLGVLTAFKEAIEETIHEARERGDLSPDRAKDAMKSAMRVAQEKASDAKDRFDFVTQREFDALGEAVNALKARVSTLDGIVEDEPDSGAEADDPETPA